MELPRICPSHSQSRSIFEQSGSSSPSNRDRSAGRARANRANRGGSRRQGVFWVLTIPHAFFTPFLPPSVTWIKGQLERGDGGFLHWQILVAFAAKKSLGAVRECFGAVHAELSRSESADRYVWKDDTAVEGTRLEYI